MRAIRPLFAVLALVAGSITTWAHETASKGVTVAHPWTRATPGGATVGAAFMEIRTDKGVADKLLSAESPIAGRTEVHTHVMEGDVMKMRKVEALKLKEGDSHFLKPMGDHIMFFDLKQPLKEGDLVQIQLKFEKAGPINVEATVEPAGAMGPHGMDHQPGEEHSSKSKSGHEHKGHH